MKNSRRGFQVLGVFLVALLFLVTNAFAGLNDELLNAAKNGNVNEVKTLLTKGADVKAKNNDGRTALMWAAWFGHPEVAKLLIAKGADVKAKDNNGWTALDYAKEKGHTKIVNLLKAHGAKE